MLIYFAEPVDFQREKVWSNNLTATYLAIESVCRDHTVYRPAKAWQVAGREAGSSDSDFQSVFELNREALRRSDLVVAILPPDQFSVGVPTEIGWATDAGKPTIVVCEPDTAQQSVMLRGNTDVLTATDQDRARVCFEHAMTQASVNLRIRRHVNSEPPVLRWTGDPGVRLGERHYDGDAGFDLYTTQDATIRPGEYAMVPCGVRIEFPEDVWGWIVSRSSTMKTWGIQVMPGIIDSGYRGEMAVSAWRVPNWPAEVEGNYQVTEEQYLIPAGTRLAQLIPMPNLARNLRILQVGQINTGDRGMNGWGSTPNTTSRQQIT